MIHARGWRGRPRHPRAAPHLIVMNVPSALPTLAIPGKPKPYLLAHRGNRVRCPENTLAAFRQALADGADALETDLHLTADGVFVCIHDALVDRTTDGRGPVAGMTLAELRTLSASYGRPEFQSRARAHPG